MSLPDHEALRKLLAAGITELGLALDDGQIDKMMAYLELLSKWNSVYNLTSIRKPLDMVRAHVLDSLSAVPAFVGAHKVLDVGSGGGLPGMILAIVYPQIQVAMIDTVHKKTAFLNQAKTELGLSNVSVHTGRVEELALPGAFDVITSRAFSELCNFINWSGHLLAPGGQLIAMKGVAPVQEIEALPEGWHLSGVTALRVPGLDAERHLVFVQRTAV